MSDLATAKVLDALVCASPDCSHDDHGELYLHSRCHVGAPSVVAYYAGVLTVKCAECQKDIVLVKVAEE